LEVDALAYVLNETSIWKDVIVPVGIALVAGTIAAFWPWIQAWQRGKRFQVLIRRELEEIGPYPNVPVRNMPWWEHAQKRFVHEEFLRRGSITQNRDFLLGLDPTLVYLVSQLWISLEKRDGNQWKHYLDELQRNKKVRSEKLSNAYDKWSQIMDAQCSDWREPMGSRSEVRQQALLARLPAIFNQRFQAYAELLPLTDCGSESQPKDLTHARREELADSLRSWYYRGGAGLLLSGRTLQQFEKARGRLLDQSANASDVRQELSRLRSDLKIDLGVSQSRERDVAMGWSEEERW
jgi:hypothetical protein